jgi:hypothetical protein
MRVFPLRSDILHAEITIMSLQFRQCIYLYLCHLNPLQLSAKFINPIVRFPFRGISSHSVILFLRSYGINHV